MNILRRLMPNKNKPRDPEVAAAIRESNKHLSTNRQILREMRAVQVKLERSGHR